MGRHQALFASLVLVSLFATCLGFLVDGTNRNSSAGCEDTIENCFTLNNSVNLCVDVAKASVLCPKFCNLCPIDGGWTAWTEWSDCHVSCGYGNRTRTRACDDPLPVNGGATCPGSHGETKSCSMNTCPVHGHWGLWSSWGTCSVTCGTGMTRRDRYCNSPYPTSSGEYCYGEGIEYRLCTEVSCSAWTAWSPWGQCSNTCGYGLRKRERNCTGMQPGQLVNCFGDVHDFDACETKCHQLYVETTSAFNVHSMAAYSGSNVRFSNIDFNQGGDYNQSTGFFTCRIPGIYFFTLTIDKSIGVNTAYCWISVNGDKRTVVYSSDSNYGTATNTVTLHLDVNDYVNVGHCSSLSSFFLEYNVFSGHLVSKDI